MNIALASDENYVPHLATLLTSIGENNSHLDEINVYVFDGGFSEDSRKAIKGLEEVYKNFRIIFQPTSEKDIAERLGGGYLSQDRSLLTYARLLIPEVVGGETCLYLDVDGVVLGKLDELSTIDFEDKAIAGVLDLVDSKEFGKVGIKREDVYINAGMIWWNLVKCREIEFCRLCREYIQERKGNVTSMDQGTLNGVLGSRGLIKILPPQYDVMTPFYQHSARALKRFYRLRTYYSDEELRVARENPIFIHFTPNATTRPWQRRCCHPLKERYRYYRCKTAFKDYQLSKDKRSVKLRVVHWLYRNLPLSVFGFIAKSFRRGER